MALPRYVAATCRLCVVVFLNLTLSFDFVQVRAGATLLYDSSPVAEELETELKASAMIDAIKKSGSEDTPDLEVVPAAQPKQVGDGKSVILIDHEDSFVHTLGNYLRQTGAEVQTLRSGETALASIERLIRDGKKPDMVSRIYCI